VAWFGFEVVGQRVVLAELKAETLRWRSGAVFLYWGLTHVIAKVLHYDKELFFFQRRKGSELVSWYLGCLCWIG